MSNFEIYTTITEWRQAVEDMTVNGLYTTQDGVLMLDRRSKNFDFCGPRSIDLNLIGPERIVVPGDVAFSYIQEALKLRRAETWPMGIH